MPTKRKSQLAHARRRALERYGIALTTTGIESIVRAIQTGHSTPVNHQTNRVVIHDVWYEGCLMRVAYDKQRKSLATVLTSEQGV